MTGYYSGVNGTRQFFQPGKASKAEVATGQASGLYAPTRPAWMDDRDDLPCKRHPANWWFAPEHETVELRDEHGRIVFDDDGKAVIAERIVISTQADADKAVELCGTCPMWEACERYGIKNERHGIWGGTNVATLDANARRRRAS